MLDHSTFFLCLLNPKSHSPESQWGWLDHQCQGDLCPYWYHQWDTGNQHWLVELDKMKSNEHCNEIVSVNSQMPSNISYPVGQLLKICSYSVHSRLTGLAPVLYFKKIFLGRRVSTALRNLNKSSPKVDQKDV